MGHVEDPTHLVIYDLAGATSLGYTTSEGLEVEFLEGDVLDSFLSCHAYVDHVATDKTGDEAVVSGSYCPASFFGGAPDSTLETLIAVERLIEIDENVFKDRYNLYMVKSSAPSFTQTVKPRGFDVSASRGGALRQALLGKLAIKMDNDADVEPTRAVDQFSQAQVSTCRSLGEDVQQKAAAAL